MSDLLDATTYRIVPTSTCVFIYETKEEDSTEWLMRIDLKDWPAFVDAVTKLKLSLPTNAKPENHSPATGESPVLSPDRHYKK